MYFSKRFCSLCCRLASDFNVPYFLIPVNIMVILICDSLLINIHQSCIHACSNIIIILLSRLRGLQAHNSIEWDCTCFFNMSITEYQGALLSMLVLPPSSVALRAWHNFVMDLKVYSSFIAGLSVVIALSSKYNLVQWGAWWNAYTVCIEYKLLHAIRLVNKSSLISYRSPNSNRSIYRLPINSEQVYSPWSRLVQI